MSGNQRTIPIYGKQKKLIILVYGKHIDHTIELKFILQPILESKQYVDDNLVGLLINNISQSEN